MDDGSAPPLPARLEAVGRPASPGLARGPVVVLAAPAAAARRAGSPAEERDRLATAVAAALADLIALAAAQEDAEAAGILELQIALLDDDSLTEAPFAAIATGTPADEAIRAAMSAVADEFRSAEDEYFRARASDLDDLSDRLIAHLTGTSTGPVSIPPGAILVARDLSPSRFLASDWSGGRAIALTEGSPTAHVAILARSRGVPLVVGLGPVDLVGHDLALLDGDSGRLVLSPSPDDEAAFAMRLAAADTDAAIERAMANQPATSTNQVPVRVQINTGGPGDLDGLDPAICDGIGLVRSEFLFHGHRHLPGEDEQLAAYINILAWAGDRPVTVRTLDAGGDKPIAGLTREEDNPFLGLRGIRLSLARPDVFRVQIRALLRAGTAGHLKVMAPMVALPAEMDAVRRLFAEEAANLAAAGIPHRMPPLGMMVEVPAAALTIDQFEVDFVSIGSNDLTQYVMAASRDATGLDGLDDAGSVAVQRLIGMTVAACRDRGLDVSLCGDAGSDLSVLPRLLALGLRTVSVAPAAVGRVKRAIAGITLADDGS